MQDNYNNWEPTGNWNDEYGQPDLEFAEFDRFVNSNLYKTIWEDADNGDAVSQDVLQQIADMLENVIWHLEHGSPNTRIQYEVRCMNEFVNRWGDFE